jgi:hypothetical protein
MCSLFDVRHVGAAKTHGPCQVSTSQYRIVWATRKHMALQLQVSCGHQAFVGPRCSGKFNKVLD